MTSQTIFLALVKTLHDLFSAVWIGGLIALAFAVMPAARRVLGEGPQLAQLMNIIQQRLSQLICVSIFVLIVTGMIEARHNPQFAGLFGFSDPYSIVLSVKHILVLAMTAVALYLNLVLGQRQPMKSRKLSARLMLLNIVLGVAILFLSGLGGALSQTG